MALLVLPQALGGSGRRPSVLKLFPFACLKLVAPSRDGALGDFLAAFRRSAARNLPSAPGTLILTLIWVTQEPTKPASGAGEAAVGVDGLAGDVLAGLGGEEDGYAGEVGGLAVSAGVGAGGQGGGPDRVG